MFVFASEIKAVLQAGVKKQVDEVSVQAYLAYQHSPCEKNDV